MLRNIKIKYSFQYNNDKSSHRAFMFLLACLILLFFNAYGMGLGAFLTLFIFSFVDFKKIKNYNFVEELFEGNKIEKKLQKTLVQLKMLLDSSATGIYEFNLSDKKFFWHGGALQVYGFSEDLPLEKLEDLWRFAHEEDRILVESAFKRAFSDHSEFKVNYRIIKPDGSVDEVEIKSKFFSEDNFSSPVLIGTVSDVSKRKNENFKSPAHDVNFDDGENRFRELAESMPQLIWVTNSGGNIEYYNQRWIDYTGVRIEHIGVKWEDVVHIDDVSISANAWNKSLATGTEFEVEYRLKGKSDGNYRWFKTRGTPIKDAHGRIVRWFGTCTDIDELKRAQNQLAEALKERDHFLSLASHEIRTPLTALRLQSDLLAFGIKNQDSKILSHDSLKLMSLTTDRQVTRLAKLVDDLLDISRIKLDKLNLELTNNEINDVFTSALSEFIATITILK